MTSTTTTRMAAAVDYGGVIHQAHILRPERLGRGGEGCGSSHVSGTKVVMMIRLLGRLVRGIDSLFLFKEDIHSSVQRMG